MNNQILIHQRYKLIIRVLDSHQAVLDGKTEILAAKAAFVSKDSRIEELITELLQPISIVYGPKREMQISMREKVKRMTGLGILIAQKHNDLKLLQTMKAYKSLAYRTTYYKLHENALQVADLLEQYSEDANSFGFTLEEIQQFRGLVAGFGSLLVDTGNQLSDRKVSRSELKSLFKDCNKILKESFDPFATFISDTHPDFYREYTLLRSNSSSRKKTAQEIDLADGEISGTVLNAKSGLPIEGATISIRGIDISVNSDADGYFLFSDLVSGQYRLQCSLMGFIVPNEEVVELNAENNSVDVVFKLSEVEKSNAA